VKLLSPSRTTVDHDAMVKAFNTRQAYSLVSWRADQEAYSIHKLVHAWGHDRLGLKPRQKWTLAMLELLSTMAHNHKGDLSTQTRLVPHVMANLMATSSACRLGYRMLDCDREYVHELGQLLNQLGRWDDECEVRVYLKQIPELVLGREHPETLTSMNNLALVLSEQGKYEEAETIHRQTLELARKVLGREHPNTLISMNNLASVLSDQGKHEEAERIHRSIIPP
jgi:tetratricopeptide (TPR) repeat protein